jgi:hypothetical protein
METTVNDKCVSFYFGYVDTFSCPKCYEAKILGNKYYKMMDNVLDRMCNCATGLTFGEAELRKLNGLSDKFDKIQKEFIGVLSGRVKCGCIPETWLDDYLKAWR